VARAVTEGRPLRPKRADVRQSVINQVQAPSLYMTVLDYVLWPCVRLSVCPLHPFSDAKDFVEIAITSSP